ncbi:Phosphoenolpyruvate--protein phosphotransferase [Planctomycetales bacterium 10988]|nr:Phosphoenolpyruvate--protein phosphotransferase [Planctomycetales bacterium 10988]
MEAKRGISVSPGIAVGVAYCIEDIFVPPQLELLDQSETCHELERFEDACRKAIEELRHLHAKVAKQVGEEEAAIFNAHVAILQDPSFKGKVRRGIVEDRLSAMASLHRVMNEYTAIFSQTNDAYLKERLTDLRDVILRLSSHLSEALKPDSPALSGPLIVVAREVLPSQALTLGDREVAGIVTSSGGQTSHAAILARSRGIPAVAGVTDILNEARNGDTIIVDGRDGHVFLNPDFETENAYHKLQREFVNLKDYLAANRDQPALSADGETLQLWANINNVADAEAAKAVGATGIGLFRTEYLFLTHPDVPDEEEQLEAYRQVLAASPPGPVTLRTLDIGGDKSIPYLSRQREANPFLGWRSIRISFEHPDFFLSQIRAILRASAPDPTTGEKPQIRMLFPMVSTYSEVRKLKGLVKKACRQLDEEGIPYGEVPFGIMIEVPAAAISIHQLLPETDFVSIGSNDLVQYLMAADRDNPKVAHLCQPLSPPVLKVLCDVIEACNIARKPVTVCGEMAGSPRSFALLYAMGLRSFSMSPAFVPTMKELASHLTQERTSRIWRQVQCFRTHAQINKYLEEQLSEICPSLKLLDSA